MELIDRPGAFRGASGTRSPRWAHDQRTAHTPVFIYAGPLVPTRRFRRRSTGADLPFSHAPLTIDVDIALTVFVRASARDPHLDPFEMALACADWDDEPYTDEERAAAEAGLRDVRAGRVMSLTDAFDWLDEGGGGGSAADA